MRRLLFIPAALLAALVALSACAAGVATYGSVEPGPYDHRFHAPNMIDR